LLAFLLVSFTNTLFSFHSFSLFAYHLFTPQLLLKMGGGDNNVKICGLNDTPCRLVDHVADHSPMEFSILCQVLNDEKNLQTFIDSIAKTSPEEKTFYTWFSLDEKDRTVSNALSNPIYMQSWGLWDLYVQHCMCMYESFNQEEDDQQQQQEDQEEQQQQQEDQEEQEQEQQEQQQEDQDDQQQQQEDQQQEQNQQQDQQQEEKSAMDTKEDENAKCDRLIRTLLQTVEEGKCYVKFARVMYTSLRMDVDACVNSDRTAMMKYCEDGNTEMVKFLYNECCADLQLGDMNGRTALLYACTNGHKETVALLCHFGVDVNKCDDEGQNALMYAVEFKKIDLVETLQIHNVNFNAKNKKGATALMMACESGYFDMVCELLSGRYNVDADLVDNDGMNAFMYACFNGHKCVVEIICALTSTKYVESKDNDGCTPLMYACMGDHMDVVEVLCSQFNADVNAVDKDGDTVLCFTKSVEVFEFLYKKGAVVDHRNAYEQTPFIACAEDGELKLLQALRGRGSNVDAVDVDGWTALIYAVVNGNYEVTKYLVEECKAEDSCDNDGYNALYHAVNAGNVEITEFLCANGSLSIEFACNPLMTAVKNGSVDIVKILCRHNINLHSQNENKETAFMIACSEGHLEIARILFQEAKGDSMVNEKDYRGRTPLILASMNKHGDVVEFLCKECKVNVFIQDDSDNFALTYACKVGNSRIANLLLDTAMLYEKFDCLKMITTTNKFGESALIAARNGRHVIVFDSLLRLIREDVFGHCQNSHGFEADSSLY